MGSNGNTLCREKDDMFGTLCWDGTVSCLYTCFGPGCDKGGGGSGGGAGGGGGGDCLGGAYCPLNCFDCGGTYY